MTETDSHDRGDRVQIGLRFRRVRNWRILACAVGMAACVIVVAACFLRGPWLDDFATEFYANPAIPLKQAWFELWPTETNPPFFYLIARWGGESFGDSLSARRLLNGLPLFAMIAWFVAAARGQPQRHGFLAAYAAVIFCGKIFLVSFPYYRSYFWQYAAETVFCGSAVIALIENRRSPDLGQLASLPFLVMLHQVTAIYAGVLIVALAAADFAAKRTRRAVAGIAACGLSALPVLAFSWLQYRHSSQVLDQLNWIPANGILASIREIAAAFPMAMAHNWAAVGCGALALASMWRPAGPRATAIAVLVGSAAAATAIILVMNEFRPIIQERYFSFAYVECICALAVVVAPWLDAHPRVAWLVPLNSAVFLFTYGVAQAHKKVWERGAEQVAAIVRTCPSTRVRGGSQPEDIRETLGLAYLGRRHGFRVLPVAPDEPGQCPVLYWSEQNAPTDADLAAFGGNLARAANAKARYQLPDSLLEISTAERTNNGVIVIVRTRAK
jgi:hypothetical protein